MAYEEAQTALNKAKIALMQSPDSVFFTTICLSLKHKWDPTVPTACCNGTEIRFSPKFFLELSPAERIFLLLHETLHAAFLHMTRLATRNPRKWNYAADYVINLMLVDRGFVMPQGGLLDRQYADMSTEQVYNLIPDPPDDYEMDLQPGTGAEGEEEDLKNTMDGILIRARLQAQLQGKGIGNIPGELEFYIESLTAPKLPWERILRKYMNAMVKLDYTFRKPNRRFFPDHLLPSPQSEGLSDIAVFADTSASVGDHEFGQYVTEVGSIIRKHRPGRLFFGQFDSAVKSVDTLRSLRDLQGVTFTGRGGTRIQPVFDWAAKNKPHVLIIFSDGEFYLPDTPPATPIIWVVCGNPDFSPPYGKVIHFELAPA